MLVDLLYILKLSCRRELEITVVSSATAGDQSEQILKDYTKYVRVSGL